MKNDKSPTYWEELKLMDADTLRDAFTICARLDLTWAVDQAKCLSYHIEPDSSKGRVLRAFCESAAGKAIERGNLPAALVALQVAADTAEDDVEPLIAQLKDGLDKLAAKNRDQALGLAIMIKAKSWKNPAIIGGVIDVIIDHIAEDTQGMLMSIAQDSANLPAETLARLIEKTIQIAKGSPYEAHEAAKIMLGQARLSKAQRDALSALDRNLSEDPAVILENLRRAEAEEQSDPKGKTIFITPKPGQIH